MARDTPQHMEQPWFERSRGRQFSLGDEQESVLGRRLGARQTRPAASSACARSADSRGVAASAVTLLRM